MKLCIISFTENGKQISHNITSKLNIASKWNIADITGGSGEMEAALFTKHKTCAQEREICGQPVSFVKESLGEWVREQMRQRNAMLFIGACGIAVRAVAPHLTDKLHDSPVLVMDEGGRYVIPILSGHVGGANALALYLAEKTGAEPVITTATDLGGKFAVDLFAKRNGLAVVNKDGIAKVSAKVLAGEEITISVEAADKRVTGPIPEGVRIADYPPEGSVDVAVASGEDVSDAALFLRPREYVIGMGCKKGKQEDEIEDFILRKIKELSVARTQIFALASISQKRDEKGLIAWCRKEGIPFYTYTAEELQEVEGAFRKSFFVKKQVGVDNVCERAAVKACGPGGRLISEKCAENGMTIAVAKRKWSVEFDET